MSKLFRILLASVSSIVSICSFHSVHSQILSDTLILDVRNDKLAFIQYDFKRNMEVVISNEEEQNYFSKIDIPFIFDPTRQFHNSVIKNLGNYYGSVSIDYFEVYKNGNRMDDLFTKEVVEIENVLLKSTATNIYWDDIFNRNNIATGGPRMRTYRKNYYASNAISIGDTLNFSIRYSIPLEANIEALESYRIFLNEAINKRNCTFILSHSSIVDINLMYVNIHKPLIEEKDNKIFYTWNINNLSGSINEVNSRAYLELPNISFCPVPEDFTYTMRNTQNRIKYQMNALCAMSREYDFLAVRRSVKIGVINKNYVQLYKYVEQFQDSIENDSLGFMALDAMHTDINNNFKYLNSRENYISESTELHQFWKMVRDKEMPDRSRIPFYMAMIGSADHDLYTGYVADKRSGVISESYMAPMLTDDFCLVPLVANNTLQTFWPKRDDMSLYRNELPFYYEGTTMALIHPEDYLFHKSELTTELRKTITPTSDVKHNFRTHTTLVEIDLDSNRSSAKCKVNLGGQYSTLTRSLYRGDTSYTQINDAYNTTVKDTWNTTDFTYDDVSTSSGFPYLSKIDASADLSNIVSHINGQIEIDTKGLINHITTSTTENRNLDYYFDFLGTDSYTYMFKFSTEVVLDNPYNISITHDEIQYVFEVSQLAPNAIKLVSKQNILKEKIAAEEYSKLQEVFEAIRQQENIGIKLTSAKI